MDALNDDQRYALSQLCELTNGGDDEASINILESVGWDVQQAANLIFGGAAPGLTTANSFTSPTLTNPRTQLESFEVDDSSQGLLEPGHGAREYRRERRGQPFTSALYIIARPVLSLLAVPIHILSSIVRFIFGLLRIPVPQFHLRFVGLNLYRSLGGSRTSRRSLGHSDAGPERWIRELEEETGAVCLGRVRNVKSASPGAASSAIEAGPSSLTTRGATASPSIDELLDDGRKILPDFMLGSYEEMLRVCKKGARIGCVILVSEEHDDVAEFKRSTLTDPTLVKLLYDSNIAVWGGDVRDREAWSASEKLQATTYPFVAFLALQPRRSPSGNSGFQSNPSPTLTILSRHQGKPVPSSGPTSAATLVSHLERHVFPRVMPFLDVLKAAEREREMERELREEQDRAYEEAARRDKERIEAKMRKEREEREEKRKREEEARREQEKREREEKERQKREQERMLWRRWIRRQLLAENPSTDGDGPLRIAIRLPNGSRAVRRFKADASLTALYAFVDSQLIPPHMSEGDDPQTVPSEAFSESLYSCIEDKIAGINYRASEWWGFHVVNAYPRKEIDWAANVRLGDVECLKGGGQVVVEMVNFNNCRPISGERTANGSIEEDDDGYDTEE
ncbi:hypothetical protein AX15_005268 [Amanita polypyramis BW_CC]|nr:hypothetical protein AX15_005268 [Amanita polypyramis BW_CC]